MSYVCFITLLVVISSTSAQIYPHTSCPAKQYYDISSLVCQPCPDTMVTGSSGKLGASKCCESTLHCR